MQDTTPSTPPSTTTPSTTGTTGTGSRLATLLRSRALLGGLVAVVALAVVGSTVAYASMRTTVTLSVDGEQRQVTSMGDTVADVLEEEGLEVGERDVVAPGLEDTVREGTAITVRYARPFEVVVDGEEETHWVTATSVSTALAEIGSQFDRASLSTSRGASIGRDGASLEVVTPKKLTLAIAGDKPVTRTMTVLTVAEALDRAGVKVDERDEVSPRPRRQVADGDKIVFTDVRVKTERNRTEPIANDTVTREDDSAPEGEQSVVEEGRDGVRDVTYRLVVRNGDVAERTVVKSAVVRAPVDRVVEIGTREPDPEPAPAAANFAGGSTVWDSLAQCESGGNWAINTGNGYYGGLQFNLSTWRAYGGSGYPHQSSRETQIAVATKLRDARGGYGAWPSCSSSLGLPR